jgi:lantibiotic modifying enzyme
MAWRNASTDQLQWLDASSFASGQYWRLRPMGMAPYRGLTGQLLFFDALARVTGNEDSVRLRQVLMASWLRESLVAAPTGAVGGFDGGGGLLFATACLYSRQPSAALAERMEVLVEYLLEQSSNAHLLLDVIAGAAGAILALAGAMPFLPSATVRSRAAAAAMNFANYVAFASQPAPYGVGWPDQDGALPLGFAHGASGIAYALRVAASMAPMSNRFLAVAAAGEARIAANYLPRERNWADLRSFAVQGDSGRPRGVATWCNGSVGIGLARALSSSLPNCTEEDRAIFTRDITSAMATGLRQGLGYGQTLCHGDMGVAEFMLVSAQLSGSANWMDRAVRIGTMVARAVASTDGITASGLRLLPELPGFMNGSAGVGYELLRLAHPDLLPSPLTLRMN